MLMKCKSPQKRNSVGEVKWCPSVGEVKQIYLDSDLLQDVFFFHIFHCSFCLMGYLLAVVPGFLFCSTLLLVVLIYLFAGFGNSFNEHM